MSTEPLFCLKAMSKDGREVYSVPRPYAELEKLIYEQQLSGVIYHCQMTESHPVEVTVRIAIEQSPFLAEAADEPVGGVTSEDGPVDAAEEGAGGSVRDEAEESPGDSSIDLGKH